MGNGQRSVGLVLHPSKTRWLNLANAPYRTGRRAGAANPRLSTSWASPISVRSGGKAAFNWAAIRGVTGSRRSCWNSPRTSGRPPFWHQDTAEQRRWLGSVVRGYFVYRAVPNNYRALLASRHHVVELRLRALRRRSQKDRTSWTDMDRHGPTGGSLAAQAPDIPSLAFATLSRQTPKVGAVCGNSIHTPLCEGAPGNGRPYRD